MFLFAFHHVSGILAGGIQHAAAHTKGNEKGCNDEDSCKDPQGEWRALDVLLQPSVHDDVADRESHEGTGEKDKAVLLNEHTEDVA